MSILKLPGTKQGSKAFIGVKQQGSKDVKPIIDPKTGKQVTQIQARIIGAKVDEFEFQGEINHSLTITLESGNKRHYFNLGYSFLAISIYNSILGMTPEQLEDVSISVYQGKKDGKNKVYVTSHGEKVEWAIQKEEFDTLVDITRDKKGNVVAIDKTLLTNKFQELTSTKQFPKALVAYIQKNALDFLDDDTSEYTDDDTSEYTDDVAPAKSTTSEIYDESLEAVATKDAPVKSTAKNTPKKDDDMEIDLADIPW